MFSNNLKKTLSRSSQLSLLLSCSFILTVGRGISLPFLPLYLHQTPGIDIIDTGFLLTCSMVAGLLAGMFTAGLTKRVPLLSAIRMIPILFCFCFIGLYLTSGKFSFFFLFSSVTCLYSFYSSLIKSLISDSFKEGDKTRIFSLNYISVNAGWVAGPLIGVALLQISAELVFVGSAACGLVAAGVSWGMRRASPENQTVVKNIAEDSTQIITNRKGPLLLFIFTVGAFFCSVVYGRFISCIAQILAAAPGEYSAEKIISAVTVTNAVAVILLQYSITRKIKMGGLAPAVLIATLSLSAGLLGFSFAGENLVFWIGATLIFTLGEIVFSPVQYLIVDKISRAREKTFYFSIQNLSGIGGALNPLMTSLILTQYDIESVFMTLWICTLFAALLFLTGIMLSKSVISEDTSEKAYP